MNRRLTLAIAMGISLLALPLWAAEGGHEEGPGMSLVYWGINFLILVGGLAFFLRKPVKEFFASRSTLIRKNIEEATQRRGNAEQKYAEYEARLKSIEKEMQELIATLKKDGELEKRRLVEQAQHQVANLKTTSERILQQELRKAKEELKKEAVHLATDLAEELLRKNVTADDQGRIVDQYLQKMEKLA
ncbi:MAG: ATP synthase F0 subunit B [bacterium]